MKIANDHWGTLTTTVCKQYAIKLKSSREIDRTHRWSGIVGDRVLEPTDGGGRILNGPSDGVWDEAPHVGPGQAGADLQSVSRFNGAYGFYDYELYGRTFCGRV